MTGAFGGRFGAGRALGGERRGAGRALGGERLGAEDRTFGGERRGAVDLIAGRLGAVLTTGWRFGGDVRTVVGVRRGVGVRTAGWGRRDGAERVCGVGRLVGDGWRVVTDSGRLVTLGGVPRIGVGLLVALGVPRVDGRGVAVLAPGWPRGRAVRTPVPRNWAAPSPILLPPRRESISPSVPFVPRGLRVATGLSGPLSVTYTGGSLNWGPKRGDLPP